MCWDRVIEAEEHKPQSLVRQHPLIDEPAPVDIPIQITQVDEGVLVTTGAAGS